jgi:CHAD domain-containing protein
MIALERPAKALPQKALQAQRPGTGGPLARDFLEQALIATVQGLEQSLAAFRQQPDSDTVHELRIVARKLRGTIALIRRLTRNDHLTLLSEHAKSVAKALASARETDVLKQGFQRQSGKKLGAKGHSEFATVLAKRQEDSRQQAIATIAETGSIHLATMTRRLNGASRQQLRALDHMNRHDVKAPAREVAARLLDELAQRVAKRSRRLSKMGDRKRHELRIAVKNLRYGTELFSPLFEQDPRLARYLSRLGKLQEELGICNDAAVAKGQVADILPGQNRAVHKAAKHFLARLKSRKKKSVAKLKRRVKRLKRAAPFWRS